MTPRIEAPGDVELATRSSKNPDTNHDFASHESDARSSYVFLRTPKLLGEQLLADDEDPPEAWVRELLLTKLSIPLITAHTLTI